MKKLLLPLALLAASTSLAHADMKLSFKWGNLKSCTSGKPNKVANPPFILKGVPAGTTKIVFKLTDLDVPNYNHGGGTVKMTRDGQLAPGAFRYKSPCPPNGAHTYQWTATAKAGSKTLAKAAARRKYPE